MERYDGQQLSLIAEDFECEPSTDWSIDANPCPPLRERSDEEIRRHFVNLANGGQFKNSPSIPTAPHDGGQSQTPTTTTIIDGGQLAKPDGGQLAKPDGGQFKNSPSFPTAPHRLTPNEGDDGTWIETDRRKGGSYRKLRWRDYPSGKKCSKYLGKVQ